jgi:hypothetical protein
MYNKYLNEGSTDEQQERRKGPDKWVYAIRSFGIVGWCLMVGVLVIIDKARPQSDAFIDREFFNRMDIPIVLRTTWDQDLARYIFYLMILGCFLSVTGLIINIQRSRRKDDGYKAYLFMLALLSVAGIVLYVYKFIA